MNSLTTIPQSIALTITSRGHPLGCSRLDLRTFFDQWKTHWKAKGTILKKINITFIVHFCPDNYSFNHNTFRKNLECVCLYKLSKVGDQKAPFSIATTPRCIGGHYSFPRIAPLYFWYIPCIAECLARRHQVPFSKSCMTQPGIEPRSPGPLVNILPTRPMS